MQWSLKKSQTLFSYVAKRAKTLYGKLLESTCKYSELYSPSGPLCGKQLLWSCDECSKDGEPGYERVEGL